MDNVHKFVIPAEAVEAALDVVMDDGHNGIECRPDRNLELTVRAALEAALPHLRALTRKEAAEEIARAIEEASANIYYGNRHALHEAVEVARDIAKETP